MTKSNKTVWDAIAYICLMLVLTATVLYGWFLNIMELYSNSDAMQLGEIVVRGIGVIAVPLGAIIGYFF